jgi:hypothetical protein
MSAIDDLAERLDALEGRAIRVKDLPVRALQDRLERDWQPSAAVLLGQGLARGGLVTVTWTAGTLSASELVSHGLQRLPAAVVATAFNTPVSDEVPLANTFDWTETTFTMNAQVDSAYTGDIQVAWIAL